MIEGELVATIRELASRGVGSKTIARTVGVARNTVRRYLRKSIAPGAQVRPAIPSTRAAPASAINVATASLCRSIWNSKDRMSRARATRRSVDAFAPAEALAARGSPAYPGASRGCSSRP